MGEVLVAAKHLCGRSGVRVEEESQGVEYFHLLMDRHEIIFANGLEAETLFLGPMALLALPAEALDEIRALFPDLDLTGAKMAPARPLLTGREARALLAKRADMRAGLLESVE